MSTTEVILEPSASPTAATSQAGFRLTAPHAGPVAMQVTKRSGAKEPVNLDKIVRAVTRYVARRMVERERALADDTPFGEATALKLLEHEQRRGRLRAVRTFIYGLLIGIAGIVVLALLSNQSP